jgi:hypothetical protein
MKIYWLVTGKNWGDRYLLLLAFIGEGDVSPTRMI